MKLSLSVAENRKAELEQSVSQYNLEMRRIQDEFEAKFTEETDRATVHISALENDKAYLAALLEEKELCISHANEGAEMLHHAYRIKLENQSVNENTVLSLWL